MGYYTSFNLVVEGFKTLNLAQTAQIISSWEDLTGNYFGGEELADHIEMCQEEGYSKPYTDYTEAKFYNWKECFLNISKKFPTLKITLSGEGEENVDKWEAYFYNGKVQVERAVITFSERTLW